jgi:hypothetical protein
MAAQWLVCDGGDSDFPCREPRGKGSSRWPGAMEVMAAARKTLPWLAVSVD